MVDLAAGRRFDQAYDWVRRLSDPARRVLLADGEDVRAVMATVWLAQHSPLGPILVNAKGRSRGLAAAQDIDLSDGWCRRCRRCLRTRACWRRCASAPMALHALTASFA